MDLKSHNMSLVNCLLKLIICYLERHFNYSILCRYVVEWNYIDGRLVVKSNNKHGDWARCTYIFLFYGDNLTELCKAGDNKHIDECFWNSKCKTASGMLSSSSLQQRLTLRGVNMLTLLWILRVWNQTVCSFFSVRCFSDLLLRTWEVQYVVSLSRCCRLLATSYRRPINNADIVVHDYWLWNLCHVALMVERTFLISVGSTLDAVAQLVQSRSY